MKSIEACWATENPVALLLLPLSWLFRLISWLRRAAYRLDLLSSRRLPVPVIVVGNITVGGTGKTPLVIWLAAHLQGLGHRPGIITRGYGGQSENWPLRVTAESSPDALGDEPVLISRRTGCPVYAGPVRSAAAQMLLHENDCDIILSDDGMQHYALERDMEIAVIDGERRFGNGFCLPAGPLRETTKRLERVDLIVTNGTAGPGEFSMTLIPGKLTNLENPDLTLSPGAFSGTRIHAVAGIGHPERFFSTLRKQGLDVETHAFPDHYLFQQRDIRFGDEYPVLMTEKDAVKCHSFARPNDWYLPVTADLGRDFVERLGQLLRDLQNG